MKLLLFFCIGLFIYSSTTFSSDLEQERTLSDLSTRLEKINQDLILANQNQMQLSEKMNGASVMRSEKLFGSDKTYTANMQSIFNSIIKEMQALQKQYKDNPYVKIREFTINVGLPPSVSITLEFKQ